MDSASRVLIVEDEALIATNLAEQLEDYGYCVVGIAHSGEEALTMMSDNHPDVVLMDINLGTGIDGITTAERARRLHDVPVIYATAFSDLDTVTRAARTAPYGYLTKPYQSNEVRAAIEVAITKSHLEQELQESEAWFSSILNTVDDAIIAVDEHNQMQFANPAACQLLNNEQNNIQGKVLEDVMTLASDDNEQTLAPTLQAIRQDKVQHMIYGGWLNLTSGLQRRVDYTAAPIRAYGGGINGAVLVMRDAEPRLAMERALKSSEVRFQKAFMHSAVGVALVTLDGRFLQMNPALASLLGHDQNDELQVRDLLVSNADSHLLTEKIHDLLAGHSPSCQLELRLKTQAETSRWMLINIAIVHDDNSAPTYFIYQLHDLTERKQAEMEMHQLANFDELTGLMNRNRLMKELDELVARSALNDDYFAVLFIDLDHFKDINDSLGHEAGDQLLQFIAERMKRSARGTDRLARLGGDEFVMLLPELRGPENAMRVANNLIDNLSHSYRLNDFEVQLGASVGISVFPTDAKEAAQLLKFADSALYQAKADGRGTARYYSPDFTRQLTRRMELEQALRHARERQELYLQYQPIFSTASLQLCGAEALMRWHHRGNHISPAEFIPIAEKSSLINDLGLWALREACTQGKQWHNAGQDIQLSVNVSPAQFRDPAFVSNVEMVLNESLSAGLPGAPAPAY